MWIGPSYNEVLGKTEGDGCPATDAFGFPRSRQPPMPAINHADRPRPQRRVRPHLQGANSKRPYPLWIS